MVDTILTFQYGRARRARSAAYGVFGRICFLRARVTLGSARQVTFRFSVLGRSFLVLSSASDSRSPEMPSCRVSRQAMPSVRSSTCYTKVARTRFGHSPAVSSAATVISGDGESGRKVLGSKRLSRRYPKLAPLCSSFLSMSCSSSARIVPLGARSG